MAYDLFNPIPDNFSGTKTITINSNDVISGVPGLQYVPEYISKDQESDLIRSINSNPWLTDLRRRVQHYGWRYDYKAHAIDSNMYLGSLPPCA
jgi:hypothetical protein